MPNTIESTTDEELLRSILDGSIEGTFEDDTITHLRTYQFYACKELEKVNLPNLISASGTSSTGSSYTFAYCTSLKTALLPKLSSAYSAMSLFRGCTSLETVDISSLTGNISNRIVDIIYGCSNLKKLKLFISNTLGGNVSLGNGNLECLVLPNLENSNACLLRGDTNIKVVDFGALTSLYGSTSVGTSNLFYGDATNLESIIIRSQSVPTLTGEFIDPSALSTDSTTKRNSNYKIYVPSSLLNSYKAATNWSNYSTFFETIEGSEYEKFWADGTPLGMSNTSSLIAFFDTGTASDWDSSTKSVVDHLNSGIVAYGADSPTYMDSISQAELPTTYYDGYCNRGLYLVFPTNFSEISDGITVEYCTASPNSQTRANTFQIKNPGGSAAVFSGTGYIANVSGNRGNKNFSTATFVFNDTGYDYWQNGTFVRSDHSKTNILGHRILTINRQSGYIGPVAIYNRALTESEINEHHQYYTDYYHVGEQAYDDNGNFIAE